MPNSPVVQTIKKVMPAVVSVLISKNKADNRGTIESVSGSGFFVDKSGIILTNKHIIIDPDAEYTVITNDDQKFEAEILARDPVNDVAILRIADSREYKRRLFPVVKLGDSSTLELGEDVIAIGNALGLFRNTVSAGIVSGLSRSIAARMDKKSPVQELRGLIQTDAAINPGNSGGPLVNLKAEAIGINVATVFGAENIGFALPINEAKRDLEELKKYGRIKRPLLGIRYILIDKNIQHKLKLPVDYGVLVVSENPGEKAVIENSPADIAGVKEKDIITECNNEKISQRKSIQDFLENLEAGDTLKLKILRNKKEFEIKVKLAERK